MIGYENWGLALLHFVWQGLLVAAVLSIVLRALSRSRPEIRYAVSLLALFVMVALPVATAREMESRGPSLIGSAATLVRTASQPEDRAPPGSTPEQSRPGEAGPDSGEPPITNARDDALMERVGRVGTALRTGAMTTIWPLLPWIVGLWVAGVLVFAVRLVGGWARLRWLTRVDASAVSDAVRGRARELADRLAIPKAVRVVRSARVAVPAVVGWIRPVILLPVSALTGLTAAQLEAILVHELAHIRRHDYLVNIFQSVVETLLFYHPAVWWVSRQIRREREHSCDDLVVLVCGGDRRLYAGALLDLETLRAPRTPRLAMAADGGSLVDRVRRLLRPDLAEVETLPRWTVGLTAGMIAVFVLLAGAGDALVADPASDGGDVTYVPQFVIEDGGLTRCLVPPEGMVSWWDADQVSGAVVPDIQGGSDATLAGGASIAPGLVGLAFDIPGPDAVVRAPTATEIEVQRFTIDAWVFPRSTGFVDARDLIGGIIVGKDIGDTTQPPYVSWNLAGPSYVGTFVADIGFTDGSLNYLFGRREVALNEWHHVAATWDGSLLKLFVNGEFDGQLPLPGNRTIAYSGGPITIGRHDLRPRTFDGLIDEVSFFDRALSAAEIRALFESGSGGQCKAGPA